MFSYVRPPGPFRVSNRSISGGSDLSVYYATADSLEGAFCSIGAI